MTRRGPAFSTRSRSVLATAIPLNSRNQVGSSIRARLTHSGLQPSPLRTPCTSRGTGPIDCKSVSGPVPQPADLRRGTNDRLTSPGSTARAIHSVSRTSNLRPHGLDVRDAGQPGLGIPRGSGIRASSRSLSPFIARQLDPALIEPLGRVPDLPSHRRVRASLSDSARPDPDPGPARTSSRIPSRRPSGDPLDRHVYAAHLPIEAGSPAREGRESHPQVRRPWTQTRVLDRNNPPHRRNPKPYRCAALNRSTRVRRSQRTTRPASPSRPERHPSPTGSDDRKTAHVLGTRRQATKERQTITDP